jgi:predicted unusual protein kinase regulating ubiquinone biosynthesis (AarF/ABC1/UbiB family)
MKPDKFGLWLKDELIDMGPVFVKLGQLISTRGDWLHEDTREVLTQLQDSTREFPIDSIDIPDTSNFNTKAIAAASFGQVHYVNYKDKDAVIKIQKPGVRSSLAADMWTLALFLRKLDELGVPSADHTLEIVQDYRKSLWKELNYDSERMNLTLLKNSLSKLKWNRIPDVYYADKTRIIMEKIDGIKITNVSELDKNGIDRNKVIHALLKSFYYQVLIGGAFHADPHPGNVSVTRESIIWYDGGTVCQTGKEWRRELLVLTSSLLKKDVNGIVQNMVDMRIVKNNVRSVKAIRTFVSTIITMIDNNQIQNNWRAQVMKVMTRDVEFAKDLRDAIISESSYVMLGRALTLIEGTCEILEPNFDLFKVSLPIIQKIWLRYIPFSEYSQLFQDIRF